MDFGDQRLTQIFTEGLIKAGLVGAGPLELGAACSRQPISKLGRER